MRWIAICLMVLAAPAFADDALREELAAVERLVKAAEAGDAPALRALPGFEPTAIASWRAALAARRDLLRVLVERAGKAEALPALADLQTRREAASKALETLRATAPPEIGESDTPASEQARATKLAALHQEATKAERTTSLELTALREEAAGLEERLAALEKLRAADPGQDPIARYQRQTAIRELEALTARKPRLPDLTARAALAQEVAKQDLERLNIERERQQLRLIAVERRQLGATSLEALRRLQETAAKAAEALGAGKLDDARKALGEPLTEAEQAAWLKETRERAAALARLSAAVESRGQAPIAASLAARIVALEKQVAQSQARDPDKLDLGQVDAAQLSQLQADVRGAESAELATAKAQTELLQTLAALPQTLATLIKREAEDRKQLQQLPPSATALDRYRLRTLVIGALATADELAVKQALQEKAEKLTRAAQLERELARLELDYRRRLNARAARLLSEAETARADQTATALRRAREEAQLEQDPVLRLRKQVAVELLELRQQSEEERAVRAQLVSELELQRPEPTRLRELHERLKAQLSGGQSLSARAVEFLLRSLEHYRHRQQTLARDRLPATRRELGLRQAAQAEIAERLWQLQRTMTIRSAEAPVVDAKLESILRQAGPARRQDVLTAYRELATELIPLLETRAASLTSLIAELDELQKLQQETAVQLEQIQALLAGQVYWTRNGDPLDVKMLTRAWSELWATVDLVRAALPRAPGALRAQQLAWAIAAASLALLGLLAFWLLPADPGAPRMVQLLGMPLLERLADGILLSAAPPLLLALASLAVDLLSELPGPLTGPLADGLMAFAAVSFAARASRWGLASGGYAETLLRRPREEVAALRGTVGWLVWLGVLLGVPWVVFSQGSLANEALPRLLYSALQPLGLLLLAVAMRPGGPIAHPITERSPRLARLWWPAALASYLLLLLAVGMDWLGYRAGSWLLTTVLLRALALVGGLALLYAVLVRSATLIVKARVEAHDRQQPEPEPEDDDNQVVPREGASEAVQRAFAALRPRPSVLALPGAVDLAEKGSTIEIGAIARMLGTALLVTGAALALWGSELLPTTRQITSGLPLGAGVTLWDALVAAVWIAGGHLALIHLPTALLCVHKLSGGGDDPEEQGGRYVLATLSRYALLVLSYGGALLALNVSVTGLAWVVTALSVGIGFGLQEIVANFVSGIILLLERPVRVGDWVTISGHTGIVKSITIRATIIENFDRQAIVLPNKALITGEVTNWTLGDRVMRRTFEIGIAYGSDVTRFLRVVQEILDNHPDIDVKPPPYVTFNSFADSSLVFRVRYHAKVALGIQLSSELHDIIHRRLAEEGITIAFPQLDIHVKDVRGTQELTP